MGTVPEITGNGGDWPQNDGDCPRNDGKMTGTVPIKRMAMPSSVLRVGHFPSCERFWNVKSLAKSARLVGIVEFGRSFLYTEITGTVPIRNQGGYPPQTP